MQEKQKEKLRSGVETALFDGTHRSDEDYRQQFIYNDYHKGMKVLDALERELSHCEEFAFSVAFVTMSGLITLLPMLEELEEKGVKGKILTTNYLNFSDPRALDKLHSFQNIELKMYWADSSIGFHTKGYMFRRGDVYRIIVGSSNLTANALTKNEEWNTKVVSLVQGEYTYNLLTRFQQIWNDERTRSYDDFIEAYREVYQQEKAKRSYSQHYQPLHSEVLTPEATEGELVAEAGDSFYAAGAKGNVVVLRPNLMQQEFIDSMRDLRAKHAKRALLISATGTGKTYAAAFAVRDYQPRRMLFLVHREQIAKQALRSFRRVCGTGISMGLLSGNAKQGGSTYVFSTMQTMAQDTMLQSFAPDDFDFIVIDEAHRAGAHSYQKIMAYFQPEFYLGMSASPERSDAFDIYKLFDHNIAYEIRLQQALEEDLLCPFHYFGITDIAVQEANETVAAAGVADDAEEDTAGEIFSRLTSDARVDAILQKAKFYGYSGERVKGLIFCSRRTEAAELSRKFNRHGLHTVSIGGETSQAQREDYIERLVSDTREDKLDYIFSVDIFNEGVDVPEINQVIMLRPTQSPIVFVQQLGRGLRKAAGKEYIVILDFIGNYLDNNFMIPIALSGDRSYNKDNIRRCLMEGSRIIPGASTIHFDAIAKQRIFASIDHARLGDVRRIKESYQQLRQKLGRIPSLLDFDRLGEMDPVCIFRSKSLGSYYMLLHKYEKAYTTKLSKEQAEVLKFVSLKLGEGKRPQELELLDILLHNPKQVMKQLTKRMQEKYKISLGALARQNVINIMTGNFLTGTSKDSFKHAVFLHADSQGDYEIAQEYQVMLQDEEFRRCIEELIKFGLQRYQHFYSNPYEDSGFSLYQKYEYEDVCRILNWQQNIVAQNMGGYKYDATTNTNPVFINYVKAKDIQESINYQDHFLDRQRLISMSKVKRTLHSKEVQRFVNAKENHMPIDLFMRKNKDDKDGAKSFYYLGRMTNDGAKQEKMAGTGDDVVELTWNLDVPVREDIYDYLTSNEA